jgi:carbon starvation protein
MTAGWMKIFSDDPRLGFLSSASSLARALASDPADASLRRLIFNAEVDAAVTGLFLVLVALVVLANARVWWQLLAGNRAPDMREEAYVAANPAL